MACPQQIRFHEIDHFPMNIDSYQRVFRLRFAASQLLLVFFALAVIYAESSALTDWSPRTLSSTVAILLFVACDTRYVFLRYRDSSPFKSLIWVEAALVGYLFLTAGRIELMHIFAGYWVLRLPSIHGLRTAIALAVALIVISQVITIARGDEWETARIVVMVPLYALALFISHMAQSERQLYQKTHALNQELQTAQHQLAETATQAERLRIARDMHDLLGHQMTVQILNLEVATHHAQGVARSHIAQSLEMGKSMLGDLRTAVRALREAPPVNFSQALRDWLTQVPGLESKLMLADDLVINDPHISTTLMRCVQEAATNTLRHSGANRFQVVFSATDDELVMELSDDGKCATHIVAGSGLIGMRERVEALAGRLEWQTFTGSLMLKITLPLRQSAVS